jgi:hypothetical protein
MRRVEEVSLRDLILSIAFGLFVGFVFGGAL